MTRHPYRCVASECRTFLIRPDWLVRKSLRHHRPMSCLSHLRVSSWYHSDVAWVDRCPWSRRRAHYESTADLRRHHPRRTGSNRADIMRHGNERLRRRHQQQATQRRASERTREIDDNVHTYGFFIYTCMLSFRRQERSRIDRG